MEGNNITINNAVLCSEDSNEVNMNIRPFFCACVKKKKKSVLGATQ